MFDIKPQSHNMLNEHPIHNVFNHRHMNNGGGSGSGRRGPAGGVQFRLEATDQDLEVCSPPLWGTISPPDSPSREISPASRAQAIAQAQQELREMVEEMPETSYELTLKDIVEQRREFRQSMNEGEESRGWWWLKKDGSVRQQESNKTRRVIVNNGSMNNNKGLLINLFYPSLIRSKKKPVVKSSSKSDIRDQSGGDGDQWEKKLTGSGDRESIGITSSSSGRTGRSGSSSSIGSSVNSDHCARRESDCSHGCSSFFSSKKKKKKKK